jgi:diguanylate cyclase (GGDEF)-like protein
LQTAPAIRCTLRSWLCGFAVLGFGAPACLGQGNSPPQIPDWASIGLIALFIGVLALARWRFHRLTVQAREGELAVRQRIETLERENAELLRAREEMRHDAEQDGLTGLWNHRMILEGLRREVDRSRRESAPLTVIMVDLDQFKHVNDTFGHPAGDLVLKEIAAIFQRFVRSYDWVGRYGGEEFLLILTGTNFESARRRAEELRVAVQTARILSGETAIEVTASFDAASGFPSDPESMVQAADAALYRAKENGRNCVMATEIEPAANPAQPQERRRAGIS